MTATIDPTKYITFKRDDLTRWCATMLGAVRDNVPITVSDKIGQIADLELTDAVVIRKRDKFAPIALYSYAHAARNAADIIEETGEDGWPNCPVLVAELHAIADLFANHADEAAHHDRKLPTP